MSYRLMRWAQAQKLNDSTAKFVLLALANLCPKTSAQCEPSHRCLAEVSELSNSTVKRAIAKLEELGLIRIESRSFAGECLTNQYTLNCPANWVDKEPGERSASAAQGGEQ